MDIVVCLKAVPSRVISATIVDGGQRLHLESPHWAFNESDEYALEEALLLKRSLRGSVTAITVGPIRSQEMLYSSIARGADRAIRVDADEFDPNIVSYFLSQAIKKLSCDLILTGVESLDSMSSQVGISVAAQIGVPYAYAVTKIESGSNPSSLVVERELGGGRHQTLEILLPALLCVQSGITPLSYTPAAKLFQARRSAIPCITPAELGMVGDQLNSRRKTRIIEVLPRERTNRVQMLTGSPEEIARFIFQKIREAD